MVVVRSPFDKAVHERITLVNGVARVEQAMHDDDVTVGLRSFRLSIVAVTDSSMESTKACGGFICLGRPGISDNGTRYQL
jgi:hypothetical protein